MRIELRTQELVAARHLAEAASRAKSEFLSNISHEIRTPINAVVGLASVALGDEPDARRRDVLDKILLSGRQLLEMVEHVLDYSSIEAGRLELVERDFLLGRVFDELALRTAEAARAKGLQLVFEIDPRVTQLPTETMLNPMPGELTVPAAGPPLPAETATKTSLVSAI